MDTGRAMRARARLWAGMWWPRHAEVLGPALTHAACSIGMGMHVIDIISIPAAGKPPRRPFTLPGRPVMSVRRHDMPAGPDICLFTY